MAKPLRLGVAYDFRNPPESGLSHQALYAAIMDQVAWLDGLGLDLVWFTEHHFVDDGYLPSWIPVAAAMAARTKRVRFSCDVCLLPFNHPLRLAEVYAEKARYTGLDVIIVRDDKIAALYVFLDSMPVPKADLHAVNAMWASPSVASR